MVSSNKVYLVDFTQSSLIWMHGERSCAGSGLEELAVAGGLVASESVQNIVWRNYNKGMQYKVHCMEKL